MIFKTSEAILHGGDEYWDPNWLDSDKIQVPPNEEWRYDREMRFEDVYMWEVLAEPWDWGVYAAWDPYAEFYVIRHETDYNCDGYKPDNALRTFSFETYYGKGAQKEVFKRCKELGINLRFTQKWVPDDQVYLYV